MTVFSRTKEQAVYISADQNSWERFLWQKKKREEETDKISNIFKLIDMKDGEESKSDIFVGT